VHISNRDKYLLKFIDFIKSCGIKTLTRQNEVICSAGKKEFSFSIANEENEGIPLDLIVTRPQKLAAIIRSKLKLNTTVFARNCEVRKTDKSTAVKFLDQYHLMNSTQSAYNFGLVYKNELLALASFSKGRKMNRLPSDKRSFELIRFCCKEGITVTGGLTKLVKNFCKEKNAGDIMTYIDKQFSSGESFVKAGFVKHSESEPNYFLVNKKTFERKYLKDKTENFDRSLFYLTQNSGNIKLVYRPGE
jgi:hypothetical protein